MSDSVRPHRQQPTRLCSPWDSPSKNTGVGCYFLLQCMKVKSESEVAQSCPTLSNLMDCSPPGSSVHGIFQARDWSGMPSPSPLSNMINVFIRREKYQECSGTEKRPCEDTVTGRPSASQEERSHKTTNLGNTLILDF